MFDDWSELPGPRGAQLAKRLYGVLDANGDGKLDFEVCLCVMSLSFILHLSSFAFRRSWLPSETCCVSVCVVCLSVRLSFVHLQARNAPLCDNNMYTAFRTTRWS